jgi:hypothetical protein
MLQRILEHVDGGDIVTVDNHDGAHGAMKFLEQLAEQTTLGLYVHFKLTLQHPKSRKY